MVHDEKSCRFFFFKILLPVVADVVFAGERDGARFGGSDKWEENGKFCMAGARL
jgi:hypothetical protein